MIYKAFKFLSTEVRGLQTAAYLLAGSALLSSLLALCRDRLLAHTFGAGPTLDLYYAAFRIPDLIFVGTGALVSVYVLIPELARRSDQDQKKYFDTIIAGFSLFACGVALLAMIFAPAILKILFPQIVAQGGLDTLSLMTRIILLQPILLGLSNILSAVTQSKSRYTLYSLSPLLYNLGIILGVALLYPMMGLMGLAWGVVLGAIMHVGVQIPSLVGDGFLTRMPRLGDIRALMDTIFVSLPRALALSMNQIAFLGLVALAGVLAPGSISIFIFAFNLQAVPLSVIGASYSVAAFPTLAAALSRGQTQGFLDHIATAARYVFFWSIPATALIIALRAYLVRVVLGSGNFDWTDTRLTAAVFALFSISLVAQALTLLLIRGYYAAGRTFMPLLVSSVSALLTLAFGFVFIKMLADDAVASFARSVMRLQGVSGVEILALGAAYACASIIAAVVLTVHFERRFNGFVGRVRRAFSESVLAALFAGAAAYGVLYVMGPIDVGSTTLTVFLKGFAAGSIGLIVALIVYWALRSQELHETMIAVRSKMWRAEFRQPVPAEVAAAAEENPVQT
jgi:putative peptidoglycan lipid II flippase